MTQPKRSSSSTHRVTATRARERARDVDKIVVEIARLMIDGEWSHESKAKIAKRECVQVATVEEWSSDAGRMLRVGHDVEVYRAVNLARLDETYASADDARGRVAAVAEQNKMLGLHAPESKRVTVSVEALADLDDAAMLERVERQLLELGELRARLMAKMRIVDMKQPALPAGRDGDG